MDSIEEPQKKVFKARKTMRVSDRQQLEAVYKVKEELLKTDVKLLNGNHENGDLDPTSPLENMDYLNDKEEVNGIENLCFDPEKSKAEWKETPCTLNVHVKSKQDDDLKCEPLSANNISPDLASKLTAEPSSGDPASDLATGGLGSGDPVSGDLASETLTSGDPASDNPVSGDLASGETVSSELVSSEPVSKEVTSEPVPGESVSTEPVSSDSACDDPASGDLASESLASNDPGSGDLPSSDPAFGDSASGNPASDEPTSETAFDPTFDPSSVPACVVFLVFLSFSKTLHFPVVSEPL